MPTIVPAQTAGQALVALQHQWDRARYQTDTSQREAAIEAVANKARQANESHPNDAALLAWEGIVLSSWAEAKGGMGALALVKQAKPLFERAIALNPSVLEGQALSTLGILYLRVPGWPLGFGDKTKAGELMRQAVRINPDGLDVNYFYADYLLSQGDHAQARLHAERALKAPPRTGRELADRGRRDEVNNLLLNIKTAAKNS